MCDADGAVGPVGVDIIGIWHEQGSADGEEIDWVNATGDGRPSSIGTTRGVTPPGLAAWQGAGAGYFVAFPAASGGIQIQFVPAFPDPSGVNESPPYNTNLTASDPARDTDPLVNDRTPATLPGAAGATASVDQVTIDVGQADAAGAIALGISWIEGGTVYFSHVVYDPGMNEFTAAAPLTLGGGGAADAATVYVPVGILEPGAMRGGVEATMTTRGGWVVTWVAGGETRASRLSEIDAMPVGPTAVSLGGGTPRAPITFVGEDGRLRVVAHDRDARGFIVYPSVCGPDAS
jgi:hypothetical protein